MGGELGEGGYFLNAFTPNAIQPMAQSAKAIKLPVPEMWRMVQSAVPVKVCWAVISNPSSKTSGPTPQQSQAMGVLPSERIFTAKMRKMPAIMMNGVIAFIEYL